jgi:hypothetical protein
MKRLLLLFLGERHEIIRAGLDKKSGTQQLVGIAR